MKLILIEMAIVVNLILFSVKKTHLHIIDDDLEETSKGAINHFLYTDIHFL
jgi:hypothetical protein